MDLSEFLNHDLGPKQIDVAKKAKISQPCILRILRGYDCKLSTAIKLCNALRDKNGKERVSPYDLYRYHLSKKSKKHHGKKTEKSKKERIAE